MNARQPVFYRPTANPHADAEGWANDQDRKEQELDARKKQAYTVVLSALSVPADQWRKSVETGGLFISPDEFLYEAISDEAPEVLQLLDELFTSEAAQKLREVLAAYHGDKAPYLGD